MNDPAASVAYDYAVIRIVPRVHAGEFGNVGVILHARRLGFLDILFSVDRDRIASISRHVDADLLERHLRAWKSIAQGDTGSGSVGLLPPSERFHWLTSPRSTMLQTSPVHPGRCGDPAKALRDLFERYCGALNG